MKYRAEIDGLRALAVIPVILFHAGFEYFSGGFIGVDVFFVISGYLITTILINDIENKKFSIINFYERRARRILPALFFMMLVCIPFAWMWMMPTHMKDFAQSLIAVSVFASNVLFWKESGYFSEAAEMKPLLHTWSLSVEEQYYVVFPIFLLLIWRFGKNRVFWIILVFAIISFGLSEWGWRNQALANFYLAPARAWEILAGSTAAFIVQKRNIQSNNVLSLIGLASIIFSIFAYDKNTPFPSVYTLVPVTGAFLLILFTGKDTIAQRILSTKLFVGIGLISYSAYLWHQPLFTFARIRSLEVPSSALMLLLSLVSIIAAFFSWKYIERPFRDNKLVLRKHIFSLAAVFIIAFCSLGFFIDKTHFFEKHFLSKLNNNLIEIYGLLDFARDRRPEFIKKWQFGTCFFGNELNSFTVFDKEKCLQTDSTRKNILLIGDSHAAQWYFALKNNYPEANIMQATASGCRPLVKSTGKKYCTDLRDFIFNDYLPKNSVDAVIIAARWEETEAEQYLIPTIKLLQNYSKDIYIFGPTIEYFDSLPRIYIRKSLFGDQKSQDINLSPHHLTRWINKDKFDLSVKLSRKVKETSSHYVSIIDLVCPNGQCSALTPNEKLMAFDYGHLTIEGAEYLMQKIKKNKLFNSSKTPKEVIR